MYELVGSVRGWLGRLYEVGWVGCTRLVGSAVRGWLGRLYEVAWVINNTAILSMVGGDWGGGRRSKGHQIGEHSSLD